MPDLALTGCTPEPLMAYLKGLGVFRLVAEQADPDARMSWQGGIAHLDSKLDGNGLETFFLERYSPTPVLAPWNGGSGFYGGGAVPLEAIANSNSNRLALYRDTITSIREFVPETKPKDEQKDALLIRCRSTLADDVVPWLDVCFVLGEERTGFFPLLGTGGNDGRLDFTNNFMQRLADTMPFDLGADQPKGSRDSLSAAVFANTLVGLDKSAIGQFNPGGIGGPNGTQGRFEAGSRVNPWDYVLMIEGALLFAGAIARRLGVSATSRAVFPFTVDSVAVGYGSATASEETTDGSRAELWLPLWSEPAPLVEVKQLFAEGRAQLGRRQARNAVEFALALNLLGVSRGVQSFTRFGFLKRNGLAFLAAPLGRVVVTLRPQARLLEDPALTEWIDRLRSACRDKEKTPARFQTALRQIDRTMFEFANRCEHGNDAKYVLDVLGTLGRAERTLATEGLGWLKDKQYGWKIRPLQGLNPQWLTLADDGSSEFRLAASLAGVKSEGKVGPLRAFLEEVNVTKFVNWSPGSSSAVWSKRPLAANLAAVFRRRQMEAFRSGLRGVPLDSPLPASLADISSFLHGETDDDKLSDLLWGFAAVDWSTVESHTPSKPPTSVPLAFGIPRLLVQPGIIQVAGNRERIRWAYCRAGEKDEPNARPDPDVFHALASGRRDAVELCVDRAARRLRSGGLTVTGYRNSYRAGQRLGVDSCLNAERLLATLLFPLWDHDLDDIANYVLYPPESKE